MRNIFLIGNGFDLHHHLPTKYCDFMCVVEYLKNHNLIYPLTISDVFSKCSDNRNISRCYNTHKEIYDCIVINSEKVHELIKLVENNTWFNYFLKTNNFELGWIDFEKEIFMVVHAINDIIEDDITVSLPRKDLLKSFILSNFRFFIDVNENSKLYPNDNFNVSKDFYKEYPHNSERYVADKKKIFQHLYDQLLNFKKALNLYFECFVECTFELLKRKAFFESCKIKLLQLADMAISFNYTSTLENLYYFKNTHHIHGIINDGNIVLGVNGTGADDKNNDIELIKFKKYYQREVYGTDFEYINWYRETIREKKKYRVVVIGHSLDETDKDIISTVFLNASEIYIAYYDDECRDDYIANIVKIFGEDGLDNFRKDQHLRFVKMSNIDKLEENLQHDEVNWLV